MGQIIKDQKHTNRTVSYEDMSTSIQEREDQIYYIDTEEVDIYKFMNTLIDEIEDLKGKLKDDDPKFYTGGMVDVEPSLSDIGHGSDALMARTRLISPGAQGTTSTGLNYLLAEDNDNIRVPFSDGGMGRRAFLKLMAALTGGVAAAKSGILGLTEGAGKKAG